MKAVLIQANAKLNLDLKIGQKRTDGYHLIKSIFQSINLSDFLLFEKARQDSLTGAIVCPETENIIRKAKKILEKELNKKLPCRIHLYKMIPVAAGLGGGSADAAATLFALNLLYKLNLSKKEMARIGARIGADVPFFFFGGTCKIEGIGEKIKPINPVRKGVRLFNGVKKNLPEFFVLFRPHKRIETKKMYQLHDKTGKTFFTLAKELCPEIKNLEKYFSKFKLKLKMSGSGPTVFCGVDSYDLAKEIVEDYSTFDGDIFICRPQKEALKIIWKTL
ncbi:MAG: 4-(cytidine 5'-diphospho)-2-C-methyl-D-erythritol kinase [Patescibacteria group bacterium]|nr:4-(cytidine 5'-diphospho)-2-C-methyl-D-erythritol kinase [Patescibacteria group bacterium]